MTKTAAVPPKGPAVEPEAIVRPDLPLCDWTREQVLHFFPKDLPKPIESYTTEELVRLKGYGPAQIGGALYLASQSCANETHDGRYGPAILSKGFTPVPFVSDAA
jgi:hypothetical protein